MTEPRQIVQLRATVATASSLANQIAGDTDHWTETDWIAYGEQHVRAMGRLHAAAETMLIAIDSGILTVSSIDQAEGPT